MLRTLGFPENTVPDGFAVPFSFYVEFMKANGLDEVVDSMLAHEGFQTDMETQADMLDDLRDAIKDAETPGWTTEALTEMHAEFPTGTSLRYRSSTNNEDLPGFNGAGLYDSKTQHPDETPLSKSLKQVYASLWTLRAFVERDFHRVDHKAAAMGVLVHPNYSDELANGVAVSFDPVGGRSDAFYVNTQLGEDLVTNPEAHSEPEEILLRPYGGHILLRLSNQVTPGQLLLSDDQRRWLRRHLEVIHERFATLYGTGANERFAMEIEFKITSDNVLAIKQARPWVLDVSDGGPGSELPPGSGGGGPAPGFYEVTLWVSDGTRESSSSLKFLVEASEPAGTCEADAQTRCLQDSRYSVNVEWWTADGEGGAGSVVHEGTNDSGLFSFFDPANWEVLIKVLDGCSLNGHV